MPKEYSHRAVVGMYQRYARAIGWNDHPKIAEQRVELWARLGCATVEKAIEHYESQAGIGPVWRRLPVITGVAISSLGVVIGVCRWWI